MGVPLNSVELGRSYRRMILEREGRLRVAGSPFSAHAMRKCFLEDASPTFHFHMQRLPRRFVHAEAAQATSFRLPHLVADARAGRCEFGPLRPILFEGVEPLLRLRWIH